MKSQYTRKIKIRNLQFNTKSNSVVLEVQGTKFYPLVSKNGYCLTFKILFYCCFPPGTNVLK